MAIRFIHAADIHLDSPLHGLSAYPDAPAAQLRGATRDAFSLLVDYAIDEAVDFVVLAGDLYDGTWRDYNTGIYFCKEMGRLKRASIPVYLLYGNHDAESEMTRKLELPENVHCFPTHKPETFALEGISVALHGQSFKQPAVTENLAANYPPAVPGVFNIGVLHTALEGYAAHASYAPCTLDELYARGYQYWALGHVHEFAQWTGQSVVVFPGNLQGRSIKECSRRGAVLVTVNDDHHVNIERVFIDVLRWERVVVDARSLESIGDVSRATGRELQALLDIDGHVPRAVRVTIDGPTRAHGQLFGLESQLRSEVLAQISAIGSDRLWLEKVCLTTTPLLETAHSDKAVGAFADLKKILSGATDDEDFLRNLQSELSIFVAKAPMELFDLMPELEQIRQGNFAALVDGLTPGLLALISEKG